MTKSGEDKAWMNQLEAIRAMARKYEEFRSPTRTREPLCCPWCEQRDDAPFFMCDTYQLDAGDGTTALITFYTGDMRGEAPVQCSACDFEGPWKDFREAETTSVRIYKTALPQPSEDDLPF